MSNGLGDIVGRTLLYTTAGVSIGCGLVKKAEEPVPPSDPKPDTSQTFEVNPADNPDLYIEIDIGNGETYVIGLETPELKPIARQAWFRAESLLGKEGEDPAPLESRKLLTSYHGLIQLDPEGDDFLSTRNVEDYGAGVSRWGLEKKADQDLRGYIRKGLERRDGNAAIRSRMQSLRMRARNSASPTSPPSSKRAPGPKR